MIRRKGLIESKARKTDQTQTDIIQILLAYELVVCSKLDNRLIEGS